MTQTATEIPWLWAGLAAYALATFIAISGVVRLRSASTGAAVHRSYENYVLLFLLAGVALFTTAIAVRWLRVGHGPFVNLFELIMSQLFSLGLIYGLLYWRYPSIRSSAAVGLPLVWVLGAWILTLAPRETPYPPTYFNEWLWIHVGMGKIFFAFCLAATGIAGVLLLRGAQVFEHVFRPMPSDDELEQIAWRFMLVAFIFHSLMLVAGAVWAQDAWGSYWSWDALETSSFLTWIALGVAIHARLTFKLPIWLSASFIVIIFVLAFLTYFGIPFFSRAAHKGMI